MNKQQETIQWLYFDMPMKAVVSFSGKDYEFELVSPFQQSFEGTHMLHMAPIEYGLFDNHDQNIVKDGKTIKNLRPIVIDKCNRWIDETMQIIVLED